MLLVVLSFSFTNLTEASTVIPANQQQQIADKLDEDAEVTSNARLEQLLAEEPKAVQDGVLSINTDATNRSLRVASHASPEFGRGRVKADGSGREKAYFPSSPREALAVKGRRVGVPA